MPIKRRTDPRAGGVALRRALGELDAGRRPEPADVRTATRYLLEELAVRAPGHAVEVRVAPYAVVQCVSGPRHTRGTPPNVIEADPETWLLLATGRRGWAEARAAGDVRASGERSDLSAYLPLSGQVSG